MKTYACKLARLNKYGQWKTARRVRQNALIIRPMTIHEIINENSHRVTTKWIPIGLLRTNWV